MNKFNNTLTKTCSSCGVKKPLSAFLQLSQVQGAVYGTICSDCRKAKAKSKLPVEPEDSTRSGSGLKIDAKAKVALEKGASDAIQKEYEEYHADRDKDALLEAKQTLKQAEIVEKEQAHRQTKLAQTVSADIVVDDIPQSLESEAAQREPEIDLTNSFKDTHVAGKRKYQGRSFLEQMTRLGKTPAALAFGAKTEATVVAKPAEKSSMKSMFNTFSEVKKEAKGVKPDVRPEEDPLKYIQDNLTTSPTKRRR